jgi:asparagine N-glycosylation enzyme membrane subunit Stt3
MNTALAGIFFGAMAWGWGMYLLIPILIVPFFIISLARALWLKTNKELVVFVAAFAVILGIFSIISMPFDWISSSLSYAQQALNETIPDALFIPLVIIVIVALAAIYLFLAFSVKTNKEKTERYSKFTTIILTIFLAAALLFTVILFATQPKIFDISGVLGSSVGEENTGHQFFGAKYNALILLPIFALILLPIRIWREKNDYFSILFFLWILTTFVMAWYKLKFTFVFGLSIAPAAAVVVEELFCYTKNRPGIEKKLVFACLAFLLLTGLAAGITFTKTNIPNIEYSFPNWKPALEWMRTGTPEGSKMFNWWNQGHWITFIGERLALNDNRNLSKESDRDYALFYITPDLNKAMELVTSYNADYAVFDISDFRSIISMGQYAFDTTNSRDPRILPYFIIDSKGQGMEGAFFQSCSVSQTEQKLTCGGNIFSFADWQNLPVNWQGTPTTFYEQRVPLFLYRDETLPILYVFNEASNNSTAAKLWFNETETMKFFEESYAKEGIKIFKINKEEIEKALKK